MKKEKNDNLKLTIMENLMLSMSRLDEDIIPKQKLDAIKAQYDKTDKELRNLRKKVKPEKKKPRRAKNVKSR